MVRRVVSQGALVHTQQRLMREVENVRRAGTLRKTTRRSASVRTEPSEAEKKKEMTSAVLVRNGRELVEDEREENGAKKKSAVPAAGAWLASARRGAYTTARSVDVKSVFEFETHVTRLAESARLMMRDDANGDVTITEAMEKKYASLTDPVKLRTRVMESIRVGMEKFLRDRASGAGSDAHDAVDVNSGEMKITLLSTWPEASGTFDDAMVAKGDAQEEQGELYAHISALGPRPVKPVKVYVAGAPRSNAVAKDSEWVRQREAIVAGAPEGVNEVVLADDDTGEMYEGSTSNFFAIVDGERVQTAGGGTVLEGTVRGLVVDVCEREGIPIDFSPPLKHEMDRWTGAFISSTSRLALPIDEVIAPGGGCTFGDDTLTSRIERLVMDEVHARSVAVVE